MEPLTSRVPYGDGEIVTYHVASPTVTWVDLQELGFKFDKQNAVWTIDTGYEVVTVDLGHADPAVYVRQVDDIYGTHFRAAQSREDVSDILRLLGETE